MFGWVMLQPADLLGWRSAGCVGLACRLLIRLFFLGCLGGVFGGVVASCAAGDDGVEFALDELATYHRDVVDVEFAFEVVAFVLYDACEEA